MLSLVSHGKKRTARRELQEKVLDTHSHVHKYAQHFVPIIQQETRQLLKDVEKNNGTLTWEDFVTAWYRIVRRIAFGDNARDDHDLTDMLGRLRKDANWSFLKPKRKKTRRAFLDHLAAHLCSRVITSLAHNATAVAPDDSFCAMG